MSEYTPTEAQIQKVLDRTGSDPRKLAIAYLRALQRARDWETGCRVTGSLADAHISVLQGDGKAAISELSKAVRTLHQHKDVKETP